MFLKSEHKEVDVVVNLVALDLASETFEKPSLKK